MEKLFTVPEVAQILQVKPSTIYTWVRLGKLPHLRLGRLVRFTLDHIKKLMEGNKDKGNPEGGSHDRDLE
jgi:excisionase family DNA binding protein